MSTILCLMVVILLLYLLHVVIWSIMTMKNQRTYVNVFILNEPLTLICNSLAHIFDTLSNGLSQCAHNVIVK